MAGAGDPENPSGAPPRSAGGDDGERGTWKHAAFHVATTIATPAAYAPLPFALASLGWPLGASSLVGATFATWYSSILIALLWRWNGEQVASLGNNIAIQIAAGSSLKAVYKYFQQDGNLTLQEFILFFGIFELLLSQLPNIHSLRWVNALCTFSTVAFAGTAIGVTIYNGLNIDRAAIKYKLEGSNSLKIFKAFNALGTIAFSFGDAMLPEIQSTVKKPVRKNMLKGVSAAYGVIILTYWQLAFSGYWAFGSTVEPYILSSLTVPVWAIVMANIFSVAQILGCFQIYCRPTIGFLEEAVASIYPDSKLRYRNCLGRLLFTSAYMALITVTTAALPFFADFVSICGAIGFTPLDFVFPAVAFLKVGKLPKSPALRLLVQVLNLAMATWFSAVAVLGCIGAVRFIVMDINTYRLFHDM